MALLSGCGGRGAPAPPSAPAPTTIPQWEVPNLQRVVPTDFHQALLLYLAQCARRPIRPLIWLVADSITSGTQEAAGIWSPNLGAIVMRRDRWMDPDVLVPTILVYLHDGAVPLDTVERCQPAIRRGVASA